MLKPEFSLVSLGCARSLVDSEKMVQDLQKIGFKLVAEGTGEKITLLNTCSFISAAVAETEDNIRHLVARKEAGELKYVVVTGCYPSRYKKEELQERFPDVDLWLTTREEDRIKQELSQLVFRKKYMPSKSVRYTKLTPSHYAYLKISEGCDNWCSFCTIPKIRGVHTSKPLDVVIAEAKLQLSFGVTELILIAEDTTCWGEDLYGKPSLPILLDALADLPVKWIRVMYVFPPRVNDELIQVLKSRPNICRYLDMPIQHVNSDLLLSMNRRYTNEYLRDCLNSLKAAMPDMVLRTSLILGFPGETEAHVEELLSFMEEFPFTQLGCFAYSEEKETRSARLEAKVEMPEIQSRIKRVMDAQYKIVQRTSAALVGTAVEVLYEGDGLARSFREAPDVDGRILLEAADNLIVGHYYQAVITGVKGYDLEARLVAS